MLEISQPRTIIPVNSDVNLRSINTVELSPNLSDYLDGSWCTTPSEWHSRSLTIYQTHGGNTSFWAL